MPITIASNLNVEDRYTIVNQKIFSDKNEIHSIVKVNPIHLHRLIRIIQSCQSQEYKFFFTDCVDKCFQTKRLNFFLSANNIFVPENVEVRNS